MPANSFPVTNTTGAIVTVTISSGTMTSVVINGSKVGSGAGVYQMKPGDVIYMLYSVAPTWAWTLGAVDVRAPAAGDDRVCVHLNSAHLALVRSGQEHNALSGLTGSDQVCTYMRGSAIGNPAACMVSKQTDYNPTRDNSANLTVKVDWQANAYGLEWGQQLTQGLRADITGTAGPVFDGGAGTAYGAQAYLQLVELVGTNVDVAIKHCTTSGGTYATLIDFGSQTAIGGWRAVVSNTTTVNRYLEVTTTGTFTLATFAVVFIRNKAAGKQF